MLSVEGRPGKPQLFQIQVIQEDRMLLGAPGLTTRSKDATKGSWPY